MPDRPPRRVGRRVSAICAALVVALAVAAAGYLGWHRLQPGRGDFSPLATGLTAPQRSILTVARTEWEKPGAPTKYSQGVAEDWCADFVSWVFREAGHPMSNPNSGSWRIPGVLTLQSYLSKSGRFRPVGDGYRPRPGDIVIYNGGDFGQHTNLVINATANRIRTVGGNQSAGIGVHTITVKETALNAPGVIGYGTLPK